MLELGIIRVKGMMDDRDLVKFRVAFLTTEYYLSWSDEMEVVFRGNVLRKFVCELSQKAASETAGHAEGTANESIFGPEDKGESQKRDLALGYILISIDSSFNSIFRQKRCSAKI